MPAKKVTTAAAAALARGADPAGWKGLARAVGLLVLVLGAGTLGYTWIEKWSPLDSLYMTLITIATIGYGETHPLSDGGRVFTILLILTSLGIAAYSFTKVAQFVIEGEFHHFIRGRRMDKRIAELSGHVILCGGGSTGRCVAEELIKTRRPFVVIERDPELLEHTRRLGDFPFVQGDATEDETLKMAGVDRAVGLIAGLPEDKDNVFVVLTARSLNPRLRIVSRVSEEENADKLKKAGADEVVSPTAIGGLRLASVMIRPQAVGFLDQMLRTAGGAIRVEEAEVGAGSGLAGRTLKDANIGRTTGMLVMAIKPKGGGYHFNPVADTAVQAGDVLIVMGTPEQLATLRKLAAG